MIILSAPGRLTAQSIPLSGSKSISNRLLLLNEVLDLRLSFANLSSSEDTLLLQAALAKLSGRNTATIDVHHAGTDMRFLTALLATRPGEWLLTGSARMKQRPVAELVSALQELGAEISYAELSGFPPLRIHGKPLEGGAITIDSSVSSQFISALLLISPLFRKGLELRLKGDTVSRPYINMTLALLQACGVRVKQERQLISVLPGTTVSTHKLQPFTNVEADWSSASYWYSICALAESSGIELQGLHKSSLQADAVLADIYTQLGVSTTFKNDAVCLASVTGPASAFHYDFTNCPDIAQTIAVTCLGLGIEAQLSGLRTLKIKETDRITALKNELTKFGAIVHATDDTLFIKPGAGPAMEKPLIHTYNDHRMAMSFAPLALVYGPLAIDDPLVVNKSYPAFWEDLKSVGFNVNLQA